MLSVGWSLCLLHRSGGALSHIPGTHKYLLPVGLFHNQLWPISLFSRQTLLCWFTGIRISTSFVNRFLLILLLLFLIKFIKLKLVLHAAQAHTSSFNQAESGANYNNMSGNITICKYDNMSVKSAFVLMQQPKPHWAPTRGSNHLGDSTTLLFLSQRHMGISGSFGTLHCIWG